MPHTAEYDDMVHVAWCINAAEGRAKEAEALISAVLSCHEQYGLGIYTPMVLKRIRDDLNAMLEGKKDAADSAS